jgi:hypothetical protein
MTKDTTSTTNPVSQPCKLELSGDQIQALRALYGFIIDPESNLDEGLKPLVYNAVKALNPRHPLFKEAQEGDSAGMSTGEGTFYMSSINNIPHRAIHESQSKNRTATENLDSRG